MSACMSGTRGSGVLSSTGDVLVRGVGGVCDMCMCLARGGVGGEGGEWMRELGLGFTNPVGTGGVLDMCLRFGCGGVGGVGGELVQNSSHDEGTTETYAPVSTRKRRPVLLPDTTNCCSCGPAVV